MEINGKQRENLALVHEYQRNLKLLIIFVLATKSTRFQNLGDFYIFWGTAKYIFYHVL